MQNQYDDEREMEVLAGFVAEEQQARFDNDEEIIPPLPSVSDDELNLSNDGSSVVIIDDNQPQEPLLAEESLLHNLHSLNEMAVTTPGGGRSGRVTPVPGSAPQVTPITKSKKKKTVRWADHTGEDLTVVFFVDSRTEYDRRPAFFRGEHEEDNRQDRRMKVLCFLILVVLLMILLVLLSRF